MYLAHHVRLLRLSLPPARGSKDGETAVSKNR